MASQHADSENLLEYASALRLAERAARGPVTTWTAAGAAMAETPAALAARARAMIPAARICADANGHRLGRWTRGQTGHRNERYYSSKCGKCDQPAYVQAGPALNEYGGGAVLYRCVAVLGNRCQERTGRVAWLLCHDGGPDLEVCEGCPLPYTTVWQSNISRADGPGLKLCDVHTRQYRTLAAGENRHGWRQTSGPRD